MKVRFKQLDEQAVLPSYAKDGDAGLDITAIGRQIKKDRVVYWTGIAVEIPKGYVGLLFPRSSVHKYDIDLTNCVGVIDSGYRGEIGFIYRTFDVTNIYDVGDRIGQLMIIPYPHIEPTWADTLSDSERGTSGWGSTGN